MIFEILYFLFLLVIIWLGSGLVLNSVETLRKKTRYSSFVISFFILGLLTSLPELAIGINAIQKGEPEIFVGNILGGIVIIFLFIIPVLAIFGNGIKLKHKLGKISFFLILLTALAPAFFILDKKVNSTEAIILMSVYFIAIYLIQRKYNFFNSRKRRSLSSRLYSFVDIFKISFGVAMIFLASQFLVNKTLYFSNLLEISPFYISLFVLSLGTNLPELSIAIRAIFYGKKEVAFGNYLGSIVANVFLFGFLSILNNGEVLIVSNFLITFIFIAFGIMLFYYFSRSHNDISKREGLMLLAVYILFCIFELQKY
jgi:cation:H+ antiporter